MFNSKKIQNLESRIYNIEVKIGSLENLILELQKSIYTNANQIESINNLIKMELLKGVEKNGTRPKQVIRKIQKK